MVPPAPDVDMHDGAEKGISNCITSVGRAHEGIKHRTLHMHNNMLAGERLG